jgi:hypothetical protein
MQYGSDISSLAAQSQAVRTIMKEYITFPILLSDKDFTNVRQLPLLFVSLEKFRLLLLSLLMQFIYTMHMQCFVLSSLGESKLSSMTDIAMAMH